MYDSYNDNNSGVPYSIREYDNYEVSSSTYSYEYYCSNDEGVYWRYEGYYKLEIEEENGRIIADGEEGKDNYFIMNLSGRASAFYLKKKKNPISQKVKTDLKKI